LASSADGAAMASEELEKAGERRGAGCDVEFEQCELIFRGRAIIW